MAAPNPTKLDANQVLQASFDETSGRLRVDSQASVNMPTGMEVVIDSTNDSIAIGDQDGTLATVTPGDDGRVGLDVHVIGGVSGEFQQSGLKQGLRTMSLVITDTGTKLPPNPLSYRNGISIRVWGSATIYVGSYDVTVANGYPKKQFEEIQMDIQASSGVELWAVCEPGKTCEVRIIEVG